jgi:transposase
MGLSRRKFTKEFKIAALRQLDSGISIAAVARSCEINPSLLHRWRRDFQQLPEHAFPGLGRKRADENRVAELERKIGQQVFGDRFFETVLAAHRRTADAAGVNWKNRYVPTGPARNERQRAGD